jgi:hypothetical protein
VLLCLKHYIFSNQVRRVCTVRKEQNKLTNRDAKFQMPFDVTPTHISYYVINGFNNNGNSLLFLRTRPKPSDFSGEKIHRMTFFGGEVKPSVPCRRFAACKRPLRFTWKSESQAKLAGHFSPNSALY